jgi:hypothetical protein
MAVDFQVVYPQETVRLDQVRLKRTGGIQALHIIGQDFRAVDAVIINDLPSPDVMVLSRTELVAQLPDSMQALPEVHNVAVLNRRFTLSPRSLLKFRIGKMPGKVRGVMRLVQLFVKILFTTPGTDIFSRNAGGGAVSRVGATYGADDGDNIVTEFVIAVQRTQRQIVAMQSRDRRSARDERLLAANVVGQEFDKLQGALYMQVELVSQAGTNAIVNVEL